MKKSIQIILMITMLTSSAHNISASYGHNYEMTPISEKRTPDKTSAYYWTPTTIGIKAPPTEDFRTDIPNLQSQLTPNQEFKLDGVYKTDKKIIPTTPDTPQAQADGLPLTMANLQKFNKQNAQGVIAQISHVADDFQSVSSSRSSAGSNELDYFHTSTGSSYSHEDPTKSTSTNPFHEPSSLDLRNISTTPAPAIPGNAPTDGLPLENNPSRSNRVDEPITTTPVIPAPPSYSPEAPTQKTSTNPVEDGPEKASTSSSTASKPVPIYKTAVFLNTIAEEKAALTRGKSASSGLDLSSSNRDLQTPQKDSRSMKTETKAQPESTNPFDDYVVEPTASAEQPLTAQKMQEILQKLSVKQKSIFEKETILPNDKITVDDAGNLVIESNSNGTTIIKSIDKNGKITKTTIKGEETIKELPDGTTITTKINLKTNKSESVIQKGKTKKTITQDQFILTINQETEAGMFSSKSTSLQKIDFSNYMDRLTKITKTGDEGKKQAASIIDEMTQKLTQDPNILNNKDYQDFRDSLIEQLKTKEYETATTISERIAKFFRDWFTTVSSFDIVATKKTINSQVSSQKGLDNFNNVTRKITPDSQTSVFLLNDYKESENFDVNQKSGFVSFQPDSGIIVTAGDNGPLNDGKSKALPQMMIDPATGQFKKVSIDPAKAQKSTPLTKNQIKEVDTSGNIIITTRDANNRPISKIIQKTDGSMKFYTIDKQGKETLTTTITPESDGSISISTLQPEKGKIYGTTGNAIISTVTLKADGSITTSTNKDFEAPTPKPWGVKKSQDPTAVSNSKSSSNVLSSTPAWAQDTNTQTNSKTLAYPWMNQ